MDWQPIETAPTDGTWILLVGGTIEYGWYGDTEPPCVIGQYSEWLNSGKTEGHWQFAWYDGGYLGEYKGPTHWAPAPVFTKPQPLASGA